MPAPRVAHKAPQQRAGRAGGRGSEEHQSEVSPSGSGFKKKGGGLEQPHLAKHVSANGRKPPGHEAKAGSSSAPANGHIRGNNVLSNAVFRHSHHYTYDGVGDAAQTRVGGSASSVKPGSLKSASVRSGMDALYAGGEGLPRRINFLPARHADAHSALPVDLKPLNAADPSREPRGSQPVGGAEGVGPGEGKQGRRRGEKERRESSERERDGLDGRLDRSDVAVEWREIRPIGAGLSNLGNTCFMNSVLQCLTYTPPLANYLSQSPHSAKCSVPGWCALCEMEKHVPRAVGSTGKVVSPTGFVRNVRSIARSFKAGRQEDAHEYMRCLLDALHRCCLPPKRASASGSGAAPPLDPAFASRLMNTFVHRTFGGYLCSQVQCTVCGYCSRTYDPFLDLSLEIVRADSVTKALHRFTSEEALDGANKYKCSKCRKKVRALKSFAVEEAPPILTVHLKRFAAFTGRKLDKHVAFDPSLDLSPFMTAPSPSPSSPHSTAGCSSSSITNTSASASGGGSKSSRGSSSSGRGGKYSLYGVLVHAGWSTNSGHYYCYVRGPSGTWSSMDDSRVQQVSEKTVLQQRAYLLFYVREPTAHAAANANAAAAAAANAANAVSANTAAVAARPPPTAPFPAAAAPASTAAGAAAAAEVKVGKKGKAAAPHVEALMHMQAHAQAQSQAQPQAQAQAQVEGMAVDERKGSAAERAEGGEGAREGRGEGEGVVEGAKEKWDEGEGRARLAEVSSGEESSEEERKADGEAAAGDGGDSDGDGDDDSDDPDWTLGDEGEEDAGNEEGGRIGGRVQGGSGRDGAPRGHGWQQLDRCYGCYLAPGNLERPSGAGAAPAAAPAWETASAAGDGGQRAAVWAAAVAAAAGRGCCGSCPPSCRCLFLAGRKRRREAMEGWGRGVGWQASGEMEMREKWEGGRRLGRREEVTVAEGEKGEVEKEGGEEEGRRRPQGAIVAQVMNEMQMEEGEVGEEEEEEGEAVMMAGPGIVARGVGSSEDDSEGWSSGSESEGDGDKGGEDGRQQDEEEEDEDGVEGKGNGQRVQTGQGNGSGSKSLDGNSRSRVVTFGGSDAVWMMREGGQEAPVGAGGLAGSQWGDDGMAMNGAHMHLPERRAATKYRYDDWDEELDRGRVKKMKRKAHPTDEAADHRNPFQEAALRPAGAGGEVGGDEGGVREAHGKRPGRWMGRDKGRHDSNRHVAKLRGKSARPRW
ncbi:hypothetical protein CLOP_g7577 [Closterium sp. NIES-67]|nr:hypothetical protein CLOP_g7577 [Closterium sp. NIES-67]